MIKSLNYCVKNRAKKLWFDTTKGVWFDTSKDTSKGIWFDCPKKAIEYARNNPRNNPRVNPVVFIRVNAQKLTVFCELIKGKPFYYNGGYSI